MKAILLLFLACLLHPLNAQESVSPRLAKWMFEHPKVSVSLSNIIARASLKRKVEIFYYYSYLPSDRVSTHRYIDDGSTLGIFVRENQPVVDECICLLFEVLNSDGEKHFRELWNKAKSGDIEKNDFVREIMRTEFQAVLATKAALKTFKLKDKEISKSQLYQHFMDTPDDFEGFFTYSKKVSQNQSQLAYERDYDDLRGKSVQATSETGGQTNSSNLIPR